MVGFNLEQNLASLRVLVSPSEKQRLSKGCGLYWTWIQMPAQPLPGCATSGSFFISLCLGVISAGMGHSQRGALAEAGLWNLGCQVQGLRLFSQTLESHRGLMGTSGTGCRELASGPYFLPYSQSLLNHMGGD